MKSTADPRPANSPWIAPCLIVRDPAAALDFYERAFGFARGFRMQDAQGRLLYCEMHYQGQRALMFLPEGTDKSPQTLGVPVSQRLYVYCDDVEDVFRRATASGATVESALEDVFWGDRICALVDPDGYRWTFATKVGQFDPSKLPRRN